LSQTGNLITDRFLDRRPIERTLVEEAKQQGRCKGVGIHSECGKDLSGFRAAVHGLADAFILGKFARDQNPSPFQTTHIGTMDIPLDCIEGVF
jgi:hypothetical protein